MDMRLRQRVATVPFWARCCCVAAVSAAPPVGRRARPHIVFLMADDLGHGNVGWHRAGAGGPAVPEAATPAMDALVASGIALERVYSFACCSPTRSSFISGRCDHRTPSVIHEHRSHCRL